MIQFVFGGIILFAVLKKARDQKQQQIEDTQNYENYQQQQQQHIPENQQFPHLQGHNNQIGTSSESIGVQQGSSELMPMYGTNITQSDPNRDINIMSTLNGEFFDHIPKEEVERFFDNTTYNNKNDNIVNGSPAYFTQYANRYNDMLFSKQVKNSELPFEQIHVGPGLAIGPDVPATGGFQQGVRINETCYEAGQSKNMRDEMRQPNVNQGHELSNSIDVDVDKQKILGDFTVIKDKTVENNKNLQGILGGSGSTLHAQKYMDSEFERIENCPNTRTTQPVGDFNIGPLGTIVEAPTNGASVYRIGNKQEQPTEFVGQPSSHVNMYDPTKTTSYIVNDPYNNISADKSQTAGFIQFGNSNEVPTGILQLGQTTHLNLRTIENNNTNQLIGMPTNIISHSGSNEEGIDISALSQRGSYNPNQGALQSTAGGNEPMRINKQNYTKTTRSVYENDSKDTPGIATGSSGGTDLNKMGNTYTLSTRGVYGSTDSINLGGPANAFNKQSIIGDLLGNSAEQDVVSYSKEAINLQLEQRNPTQMGGHNPLNSMVVPNMNLKEPMLQNSTPQLSKLYSSITSEEQLGHVINNVSDNITSVINTDFDDNVIAQTTQSQNNPWNIDINQVN